MVGIGQRWRLGLGVGAAACVAMALGAAAPPPAAMPVAAYPIDGAPADRADISVMTYNVQGLPWPIALGREADLQRIGERLAALRRAGRQPAIVVLQEAFTDDAKRIAALAGYRHVATGPARDDAPAMPADDVERAFVRGGSALAGEGVGKGVDSGLMILSDHPILAVRRAAFAEAACAGFDCLANKGVAMALVQVPGLARPLAVIATHLNARKASGVDIARAFEAYRRQVATLDRILGEAHALDVPTIVAGDLNVGRSPVRRALMEGRAARWTGTPDERGALAACVAAGDRCRIDPDGEARRALNHNKDWQIVVPGGGIALQAHGVDIPFGREPDGGMLSDHAGYVVHYRAVTAGGPAFAPRWGDRS